MAFYQYRQNNSGGSFNVDPDKGISVVVIVEARDSEMADKLAEYVGLYFDGSYNGSDCSCCGDRWYRADRGDEVPSYYGAPIDFAKKTLDDEFGFIRQDVKEDPLGYVHYLDGSVVGFY